MPANEMLSDCKFCSIVSKTNGEDQPLKEVKHYRVSHLVKVA